MSEPQNGVEKPAARRSRALTDEESRAIVARNFIAILSTVGEGQPYAIPFIYGFDDQAFFAVLSPGRKARNIENNARVCVTIVETEDNAKRWRSVIALGTASWVDGVMKLGHALNTIRKQYPGNPIRSAPGLSALKGYHVMRVDVEELTGRTND